MVTHQNIGIDNKAAALMDGSMAEPQRICRLPIWSESTKSSNEQSHGRVKMDHFPDQSVSKKPLFSISFK